MIVLFRCMIYDLAVCSDDYILEYYDDRWSNDWDWFNIYEVYCLMVWFNDELSDYNEWIWWFNDRLMAEIECILDVVYWIDWFNDNDVWFFWLIYDWNYF
jgi:hypothetical protein